MFLGFVNILTGLSRIFLLPKLSIEEWVSNVPLQIYTQGGGALSLITGFLLIGLGHWLRERRKIGWWVTMILVVLSILSSVGKGIELPSMVLGLLAFAGLLAHRQQYDRPLAWALPFREGLAVLMVGVTLVYGSYGCYRLRSEFEGIETWADAFYFTVVTCTTLGYGDILPMTFRAKWFAVSMVVMGVGSFITALTFILGPILEGQAKALVDMIRNIKTSLLRDHVIVCGRSAVADALVEELAHNGIVAVRVDQNLDRDVKDKDNSPLLVAEDPSEEDALRKAGVAKARSLVACSDDDANNAFVILTAKGLRDSGLNPDLRILALAKEEAEFGKFRLAGADYFFAPAAIGGKIMARVSMAKSDSEIEPLKDGRFFSS